MEKLEFLWTVGGNVKCGHNEKQYGGSSKKIFFFFQSNVAVFLNFILFIYLFIIFIIFWLCWVFISVRGLSLVVASGGHSSSRCAGLSLSQPLLLRSTGSRRAGSVVVAHGHSCSAACGIFPDQGLNPCPLHWQADSQPLLHQGSPKKFKTELSYDPAISLLGIYPEELKTGSQRNIFSSMFIAALFIIAKRWKQPKCPLTDKWINKMCYIFTMEYYSTIKMEILHMLQHGWTLKTSC